MRPFNWSASVSVQHELAPRVSIFGGYFRRWFGNFNNLKSILQKMAEVRELASHVPLDLTIVTTRTPDVDALLADVIAQDPARISGSVVPWSIEATWKALEACDVVWIPVAEGERVLEGIRRNDLYIFTHQEFEQPVRERMEAMMASFPPETAPAARAAAYVDEALVAREQREGRAIGVEELREREISVA